MEKKKEQIEKEGELVLIGITKKWELGERCVTPTMRYGDRLGEELGSIVYDRDERFGPMYCGHDMQGQEIFKASFRMKDVVDQFVENKERLLAQARAIKEERSPDPLISRGNDESIPSPFGPGAEPAKVLAKKSRKPYRAPKAKAKTRSR